MINTLHGLYASPDDPVFKRAVFYLAEAFAAQFSDHELVQSAEDVALIRRLRLVPPTHLTHLGNGVDLERFDPEAVPSEKIAALRNELGLAPGKPVVGVVGRLVTEKGLVELFAAFRQLRVKARDFEVLVIGPSDEDKSDALPSSEIATADRLRTVLAMHLDTLVPQKKPAD